MAGGRDGSRRSNGPAELPSHDRTVGLAPEDDLEAVPGEGRCDPGKNVASVTWHRGVHRVGLQGGRAACGGHFGGGLDQGCRSW
jgi:hypothetical protein